MHTTTLGQSQPKRLSNPATILIIVAILSSMALSGALGIM